MALLLAWMPPPTGIVMCHYDVSESVTQRESIHVRRYHDRHRPCKARFQLHRACANGTVVFREKLTRVQLLAFMSQQPECIVAMEACATAQCWGREIETLGHTVRLIAPIYVKPSLKRRRGRQAVCCAEIRISASTSHALPGSGFRQTTRGVFRTRQMFIGQRSQMINASC